MKRPFIAILYFQMLVMTGACQKPPQPEPLPHPKKPVIPKTYPTKLEVVWNAVFYSDSAGDYFHEYQIADEQYIVLANIYDGEKRGIGVYNMQTGKRHSAWQNDPDIFAVTEDAYLNDCKTAGKNKEIILIYNRRALFGYSLHSGQRLWSTTIFNQQPFGEPKISADANYAYVPYAANGALSKSWCRLAKIDVYSGKKTDILTLYIEDDYEFCINPPSSYVNSEGDTLLYFTTSGWNFQAVHGRVWAYCYNMTKKKMLWVNKQFTFDTDASSSQPPPFVIENDKLIVTSMRAIHCFNRLTGELIWQREGLGFSDRPPLYYEGRLYIRSGNPCILMCLDAQTGVQIWENTSSKPLPAFDGRMAIYKDRLYCSISGGNAKYYLFCADIHTGKELWRDWGTWGNIAFDVLIDQKTGYLYCNTDWSTMCIDLNKTPKK